MFALLRQRHLRWLGHIRRMEDGCIHTDVFYHELSSAASLRFRDLCKRIIKSAQIGIESWESAATWLQQLATGDAESYEEGRRNYKWTVDAEERKDHISASICLHLHCSTLSQRQSLKDKIFLFSHSLTGEFALRNVDCHLRHTSVVFWDRRMPMMMFFFFAILDVGGYYIKTVEYCYWLSKQDRLHFTIREWKTRIQATESKLCQGYL